MKNKKDIKNFKKKSKFLKKNGWVQNWHPDNWIPKEWADDSSWNSDNAGIPIDEAYSIAKKNSIIDESSSY